MDINQVRFGNYSIGNSKTGAKRNEGKEKEQASPEAKNEGVKNLSAEEVFGTLNAQAMQNKVGVVYRAEQPIDIEALSAKYADRMPGIEAAMAEFENGVNQIADVIGQEMPNMSAQNKNALAARIFAQE